MKKVMLNKKEKGNIENEVCSILLDDGNFLFKIKKKSTSSMWSCFDIKNDVGAGLVSAQKGITLIALIITIIIMLILSAVVMNLTIR